MISVADKRAMLKKEFEEIDANHDSFISQQELYYFLDRKVKLMISKVLSLIGMWRIKFLNEWTKIMMEELV